MIRYLANQAVPYLDLIIMAAVVMGCICVGLYLAVLVEKWMAKRRKAREQLDAATDELIRQGFLANQDDTP